jgi:hypothetical protein
MDKQSWREVMQNQYSLPDGHTLVELTNELFSYLGNTDPELRDNIGYIVYANWLRMGLYSYDVILEHVSKLTNNLVNGIGERDTDSVFIRSFSVLFLAEIIHNDNKAPQFKKVMISELVEKALWYLEHEKDPRGYIRDKGWAHALAHTADLLTVLAKNELSDGTQHLQMLNGITEKLGSASDWVSVHGEDDRLSAAVLAIFTRGSLETDAIRDWLFSFTENWKGAWMDEKRTTAFFNIRNFIRSLYLKLITEEELKHRKELERIILETTQRLRTW